MSSPKVISHRRNPLIQTITAKSSTIALTDVLKPQNLTCSGESLKDGLKKSKERMMSMYHFDFLITD